MLNTNNTGAFPSASVLMNISIYVSLIRLRYVFNNFVYRIYILQCYTNSVGISNKNITLIYFIIAFGHP